MAKKSKKKKHQPKIRQKPEKYPTIFYKQLLLTIISVALIYIFFTIPFYNWWFEQRILRYYQEVPHQMQILDNIDRRMAEWYGYNYLVPKMIKEKTSESSVILLPTQQYVKKNFSENYYRWQNARWCYYFTGYRRYIIYKPGIGQDYSHVTHAILCKNQQISLVQIDSPQKIKIVLETYNTDG